LVAVFIHLFKAALAELLLHLNPSTKLGKQMFGRFNHNKFDAVDRKLTDDEVMFHLDRIYTPFTGFDVAGVDDKSVLMAAIFPES
jgi:hypothetical protein